MTQLVMALREGASPARRNALDLKANCVEPGSGGAAGMSAGGTGGSGEAGAAMAGGGASSAGVAGDIGLPSAGSGVSQAGAAPVRPGADDSTGCNRALRSSNANRAALPALGLIALGVLRRRRPGSATDREPRHVD